MKRVLMIIPFFPPMAGGGVYRPLSFVKYLGRHGWRPTVIAPRGDSFWIRDEKLLEQIPDDCDVIRTDTLSGQSLLARRGRGSNPQRRSSRAFGFARRVASALIVPDTYRGWMPYALTAARRALAAGRFDAVYSTSPPETSHLVAGRLHDESGLPWIADFRDPWMNLYLLKPPTPLHAWMHRRMERAVCRNAHAVVTTRWHEELLRARYPEGPGVTRIANGYDGAEAQSVSALAPEPGPMRITHAGMLTQNRSAIPFLRGLRRLLHVRPELADDISVLFLGAREDENERAVHGFGLGGVVRFQDTASHAETLKIERTSHILLLIKHVNPDYNGLVPGKLFEYIGLERPVLALAPRGEASDIIRSLNRGEVARPEDESEVADAIARMYDAHKTGTLESQYALEPRPDMTREHHAAELAALLDRVAAGDGEVGK